MSENVTYSQKRSFRIKADQDIKHSKETSFFYLNAPKTWAEMVSTRTFSVWFYSSENVSDIKLSTFHQVRFFNFHINTSYLASFVTLQFESWNSKWHIFFKLVFWLASTDILSFITYSYLAECVFRHIFIFLSQMKTGKWNKVSRKNVETQMKNYKLLKSSLKTKHKTM